MSRTMVIGVGNALRGDDAAGLQVARRLSEQGVANVHESSGETASLIELWRDAGCVLIADAAQSGAEPGTVTRYDASAESLPAKSFQCSTHFFGVAEAIELARALDSLPARVIVFGIEAVSFDHGAPLTAAVAEGVASAATMIAEELSHA